MESTFRVQSNQVEGTKGLCLGSCNFSSEFYIPVGLLVQECSPGQPTETLPAWIVNSSGDIYEHE